MMTWIVPLKEILSPSLCGPESDRKSKGKDNIKHTTVHALWLLITVRGSSGRHPLTRQPCAGRSGADRPEGLETSTRDRSTAWDIFSVIKRLNLSAMFQNCCIFEPDLSMYLIQYLTLCDILLILSYPRAHRLSYQDEHGNARVSMLNALRNNQPRLDVSERADALHLLAWFQGHMNVLAGASRRAVIPCSRWHGGGFKTLTESGN